MGKIIDINNLSYFLDKIKNYIDENYVTKSNIKTINGTSILGNGDITVVGAYPLVNHGTSDTTFILTPNTFHVWGEVTVLDLDFGGETSGIANEYLFQFNSGATATTLTLPDTIKWVNNSAPTIEANKTYQVSVLMGLASVMVFDISLITFTIDGTEYQAVEGMTWEEWVESSYNAVGYTIYYDNYIYKYNNGYNHAVKLNGAFVGPSGLIIADTSYSLVSLGGGGGTED